MQARYLIIIALAGMGLLLGFNIISGNRHENRQEAIGNKEMPANTSPANNTSTSTGIKSKPLGEQPKAIIDKATTQIDQARQADKERLEQLDNTR